MHGNRENILKRRIGRKDYWMAVVGLFVAGLTLGFLAPGLSGGLGFVWMLVFIWRLHDFGRSGWWSMLYLVAIVVLILAGVIIAPDAYLYYMDGTGEAPGPADSLKLLATVGSALLINFGFIVWLGVKKGDPDENRYGWPIGVKPPRTADIFS